MQPADKALGILAAFNEGRQDVGVSELAVDLGLHKSTVSRLLATLERRGLVQREGDRFVPGFELARLGGLAMRGFALVGSARESLEGLAKRTSETVNLAVGDGDRALNVHQVQTGHLVGLTDWTGDGRRSGLRGSVGRSPVGAPRHSHTRGGREGADRRKRLRGAGRAARDDARRRAGQGSGEGLSRAGRRLEGLGISIDETNATLLP